MFAVRIVKSDHYLAPPVRGMDICYSDFRSCQLTRVPVVRIFGSTPVGQKTCVHLHRVFPYILVPYDGAQPLERYAHQLAVALETALTGGQAATEQHVYKVELVTGTPFYGYHAKEHHFLKIYFIDPDIVSKAIDLLQTGAVLNRTFQPHEAHVPFILQAFIDYNLYGMNLIKFSSVKFRHSGKESVDGIRSDSQGSSSSSATSNLTISSQQYWNPNAIPSEFQMDKSVARVSSCELELDALAGDILNTKELAGVNMNPGIQAIWEDERMRRRRLNESSQVINPCSQDRPSFEPRGSELLFLGQLRSKLETASTSQESHLGLDDSQVHEHSGVESNALDPGVFTSPRLNSSQTVTSSQKSSQQSFNTDDQEILDLIMNLIEDDPDDRPSTSRQVRLETLDPEEEGEDDGAETEDELTMSQCIWDTDPGLTATTTDSQWGQVSSDDSSDWGDDIPQVDGPTDPPDKLNGTKKRARPELSSSSSSLDDQPEPKHPQPGASFWAEEDREASGIIGSVSYSSPITGQRPLATPPQRFECLDEWGFTHLPDEGTPIPPATIGDPPIVTGTQTVVSPSFSKTPVPHRSKRHRVHGKRPTSRLRAFKNISSGSGEDSDEPTCPVPAITSRKFALKTVQSRCVDGKQAVHTTSSLPNMSPSVLASVWQPSAVVTSSSCSVSSSTATSTKSNRRTETAKVERTGLVVEVGTAEELLPTTSISLSTASGLQPCQVQFVIVNSQSLEACERATASTSHSNSSSSSCSFSVVGDRLDERVPPADQLLIASAMKSVPRVVLRRCELAEIMLQAGVSDFLGSHGESVQPTTTSCATGEILLEKTLAVKTESAAAIICDNINENEVQSLEKEPALNICVTSSQPTSGDIADSVPSEISDAKLVVHVPVCHATIEAPKVVNLTVLCETSEAKRANDIPAPNGMVEATLVADGHPPAEISEWTLASNASILKEEFDATPAAVASPAEIIEETQAADVAYLGIDAAPAAEVASTAEISKGTLPADVPFVEEAIDAISLAHVPSPGKISEGSLPANVPFLEEAIEATLVVSVSAIKDNTEVSIEQGDDVDGVTDMVESLEDPYISSSANLDGELVLSISHPTLSTSDGDSSLSGAYSRSLFLHGSQLDVACVGPLSSYDSVPGNANEIDSCHNDVNIVDLVPCTSEPSIVNLQTCDKVAENKLASTDELNNGSSFNSIQFGDSAPGTSRVIGACISSCPLADSCVTDTADKLQSLPESPRVTVRGISVGIEHGATAAVLSQLGRESVMVRRIVVLQPHLAASMPMSTVGGSDVHGAIPKVKIVKGQQNDWSVEDGCDGPLSRSNSGDSATVANTDVANSNVIIDLVSPLANQKSISEHLAPVIESLLPDKSLSLASPIDRATVRKPLRNAMKPLLTSPRVKLQPLDRSLVSRVAPGGTQYQSILRLGHTAEWKNRPEPSTSRRRHTITSIKREISSSESEDESTASNKKAKRASRRIPKLPRRYASGSKSPSIGRQLVTSSSEVVDSDVSSDYQPPIRKTGSARAHHLQGLPTLSSEIINSAPSNIRYRRRLSGRPAMPFSQRMMNATNDGSDCTNSSGKSFSSQGTSLHRPAEKNLLSGSESDRHVASGQSVALPNKRSQRPACSSTGLKHMQKKTAKSVAAVINSLKSNAAPVSGASHRPIGVGGGVVDVTLTEYLNSDENVTMAKNEENDLGFSIDASTVTLMATTDGCSNDEIRPHLCVQPTDNSESGWDSVVDESDAIPSQDWVRRSCRAPGPLSRKQNPSFGLPIAMTRTAPGPLSTKRNPAPGSLSKARGLVGDESAIAGPSAVESGPSSLPSTAGTYTSKYGRSVKPVQVKTEVESDSTDDDDQSSSSQQLLKKVGRPKQFKMRGRPPGSRKKGTGPQFHYKKKVLTQQTKKANTLLLRAKGQKKRPQQPNSGSPARVDTHLPTITSEKYAGQTAKKGVYIFGGRKGVAALAIKSKSGLRTIYKIDPADDIRIIRWPPGKGFVVTQLIRNTQLRYTVRGTDGKPPPNQIWMQDQEGRYSIVVDPIIRTMHVDSFNPYVSIGRLSRRIIYQHTGIMPPVYDKSLRMENHMPLALRMMKTRKGRIESKDYTGMVPRNNLKKASGPKKKKKKKNAWGSYSEMDDDSNQSSNSDLVPDNSWQKTYPIHIPAPCSPSAEIPSLMVADFLAQAAADTAAAEAAAPPPAESSNGSIDDDYVSVASDWEEGGGVLQNPSRLKLIARRMLPRPDVSCRRPLSFNYIPQHRPAPPTYHRQTYNDRLPLANPPPRFFMPHTPVGAPNSTPLVAWYSPQPDNSDDGDENDVLEGGGDAWHAKQAVNDCSPLKLFGNRGNDFLSPPRMVAPSPLDAHCNGSNDSSCLCPNITHLPSPAGVQLPVKTDEQVDYWSATDELEKLGERNATGNDVLLRWAFMSPIPQCVGEECESPPACASPTENSHFCPVPYVPGGDGDDDNATDPDRGSCSRFNFVSDVPHVFSRRWEGECSVSDNLSASISIELPDSDVEEETDVEDFAPPNLVCPTQDPGYQLGEDADACIHPNQGNGYSQPNNDLALVDRLGATFQPGAFLGVSIASESVPVPQYPVDLNRGHVVDVGTLVDAACEEAMDDTALDRAKEEFDFSLFEGEEDRDDTGVWNVLADGADTGRMMADTKEPEDDCDLARLKSELDAAANLISDDPMEEQSAFQPTDLLRDSSYACATLNPPFVASSTSLAQTSMLQSDSFGFLYPSPAYAPSSLINASPSQSTFNAPSTLPTNPVTLPRGPADQFSRVFADQSTANAAEVQRCLMPMPDSASYHPGENSPPKFDNCWPTGRTTIHQFQQDDLLHFPPSSCSGDPATYRDAEKTAGLPQADLRQSSRQSLERQQRVTGAVVKKFCHTMHGSSSRLVAFHPHELAAGQHEPTLPISSVCTSVGDSFCFPSLVLPAMGTGNYDSRHHSGIDSGHGRLELEVEDGVKALPSNTFSGGELMPKAPQNVFYPSVDVRCSPVCDGGLVRREMLTGELFSGADAIAITPSRLEESSSNSSDYESLDSSPNDFIGFEADVVASSRLQLLENRQLKRSRANSRLPKVLADHYSPTSHNSQTTFTGILVTNNARSNSRGTAMETCGEFSTTTPVTPTTPASIGQLLGESPPDDSPIHSFYQYDITKQSPSATSSGYANREQAGPSHGQLDETPIRSFYQFEAMEIPPDSPRCSEDATPFVSFDDTDCSSYVTGISSTEKPAPLGGIDCPGTVLLEYPIQPPSPRRIRSTLAEYDLSEVRHRQAFCSDPRDVPARSVNLGGTVGPRLQAEEAIVPFESQLTNTGLEHWSLLLTFAQADGNFACPPECPDNFGIGGSTQRELTPTLYEGNFFVPHVRPPPPAVVANWLAERRLIGSGSQQIPNARPPPAWGQGTENRRHDLSVGGEVARQTEPSSRLSILSPIHESHETSLVSTDCSPIPSSQTELKPPEFGYLPVLHSTPQMLKAGYRRTWERKHPAMSLNFGRSDDSAIQLQLSNSEPENVWTNSSATMTEAPSVKRAHSNIDSRLPEDVLCDFLGGDDLMDEPLAGHDYFRPMLPTSSLSSLAVPTIPEEDEQPETSPTSSFASSSCRSLEQGSLKREFPVDERTPMRKRLFYQKLKDDLKRLSNASTSQIDGPTPRNTYGFKLSAESLQETTISHLYQYVTLMSLELHVETVGSLRPNPAVNPIRAIFFQVHRDIPPDGPPADGKRLITGIIVAPPPNVTPARPSATIDPEKPSTSTGTTTQIKRTQPNSLSVDADLNFSPSSSSHNRSSKFTAGVTAATYVRSQLADGIQVIHVATELNLIQEFVNIVNTHDPDILVGYEVQMASWGFLVERGQALGLKLCHALSRVPGDPGNSFKTPQSARGDDEFFLKIAGRDILNLSMIMRHELALYSYTFENVAYHVLHQRIPLHSFESLTDWFNRAPTCWRTLQHYLIRVGGSISILDQLNFVGRTSELARLFGIQFHEVLDRGTQFRVESMMLRLAKLRNYVPVSPSAQQRSSMRAPEYLPLILEPLSRYFTNPVVVLDFQSLYPSMMIAYNYCFSTCLGRVESIGNPDAFQFGCTSLKVPAGLMRKLEDKFTIAPCGTAFVKPQVRKGILPQMLEDILSTRIMVKLAMKKHKGDKALHRMLDARQLGLKLIANVTYGYTSASFSGRMPCIEIADSVVSKGRETLERAIAMIKNTERWDAQVIYGDTDSIFVLLEGRSKDQAFAIGQEIADLVTADNPKPVKLKMEKVYMPCVLETKKRYVGFMYETPDQAEPTYDAKGIETVRRDGCPAVAKILEKMLRTLFRTHDVSQVKSYVQHQFEKIITGRSGLADFVFTRKYQGRGGYRMDSAPALRIARQLARVDPRGEPRYGERVPYVVVYGSPGAQLMNLVRHPHELLTNTDLRLNTTYYITKAILPALNRVIMLLGDDVNHWYTSLSRTVRVPLPYDRQVGDSGGATIARYFVTANCPVCDTLATNAGICAQCRDDPQATTFILTNKIMKWEKRYADIVKVCQGCTNCPENPVDCASVVCPTLFRRFQASRDLLQSPYLRRLLDNLSLDW